MHEETLHDLHAELAAEQETEEAKRFQRQLDDDDLQWLMSDKRGRRYVWRMLGVTGVFRNPFSMQREATDFNCGKQVIGQTMLADIHRLCPESYNKMVMENRKNARASRTRR